MGFFVYDISMRDLYREALMGVGYCFPLVDFEGELVNILIIEEINNTLIACERENRSRLWESLDRGDNWQLCPDWSGCYDGGVFALSSRYYQVPERIIADALQS